jgi:hypothetical protein
MLKTYINNIHMIQKLCGHKWPYIDLWHNSNDLVLTCDTIQMTLYWPVTQFNWPCIDLWYNSNDLVLTCDTIQMTLYWPDTIQLTLYWPVTQFKWPCIDLWHYSNDLVLTCNNRIEWHLTSTMPIIHNGV